MLHRSIKNRPCVAGNRHHRFWGGSRAESPTNVEKARDPGPDPGIRKDKEMKKAQQGDRPLGRPSFSTGKALLDLSLRSRILRRNPATSAGLAIFSTTSPQARVGPVGSNSRATEPVPQRDQGWRAAEPSEAYPNYAGRGTQQRPGGRCRKTMLEVAPAGSGSPSPNCQKCLKSLNLHNFFSEPGRREAAFARGGGRHPPTDAGKLEGTLVKSKFFLIFRMLSRSIAAEGPSARKLSSPVPPG